MSCLVEHSVIINDSCNESNTSPTKTLSACGNPLRGDVPSCALRSTRSLACAKPFPVSVILDAVKARALFLVDHRHHFSSSMTIVEMIVA